VLTHHLVPVLFELVISIAKPFLLNKLSLSILSHEPSVIILLYCFNMLLQVSCLVVHGTRHRIMISDQVPLSLLHLPHQIRIRLSFPAELTVQVSILIKEHMSVLSLGLDLRVVIIPQLRLYLTRDVLLIASLLVIHSLLPN
jgi:hypothetical protein